jgi:hypothetical protein
MTILVNSQRTQSLIMVDPSSSPILKHGKARPGTSAHSVIDEWYTLQSPGRAMQNKAIKSTKKCPLYYRPAPNQSDVLLQQIIKKLCSRPEYKIILPDPVLIFAFLVNRTGEGILF